ncbi:hypothetical protein DRF59_15455 [Chryseobacterium flavum]|uniref:Uncharacterized protein n=1 Tax=Chryseobacterium flavum TaxID=415851 RepID=A0A3D9CIK6_9FLAO|nr:lipopolysaccharide biosynthesis protein [Chryseobacterium flavum]REC65574.1 hypothetical protein DRF59_15455 [Chryseobacterium flavum]
MEKKKNNSLAYLTIIYMIGNFSSKVLSFVLVFFMTYFLTKEEVGEYDLILTSVSFLVPCISLQIDSSLLRWLLDKTQTENKDQIFENVFGLLFRNIILYTGIYWILAIFIKWDHQMYLYIFSVLMMIFPTLQQGTRGIGKNRIYAATSVVYSLFFVFNTVIALYFFKSSVDGVLLANIIALTGVIIWLFIKNNWWKYLKLKKINLKLIKELCGYSLPLLPNTLSWWLISASTRYVILGYLGKEYNGLFAISYKIPTIVLIVTNVFTLAWQEKAIKTLNQEEAETQFTNILSGYVNLVMGIIIILVSCSKFMMQFIGKGYYESWKYIPILLFAVFLQAISAFYGAGYLRAKDTKGILYSSILGGIVTISTSFVFVQYMGLYGISLSIMLGYLVLLIFRGIHIQHFLKIKFPIINTIILTLIFIILTGLLYVENKWTFPLSLIISLIVFTIFNYKHIISLKSKVISKWKKSKSMG